MQQCKVMTDESEKYVKGGQGEGNSRSVYIYKLNFMCRK